MIFACSYSLLPWIVTPSGARETVPEMNNISPTWSALDHRPGGGSGTWGLVIFSIFIVSSFIQINRITSAKIDPQSSTRQAKVKKQAGNNCVFVAYLIGNPRALRWNRTGTSDKAVANSKEVYFR